MGQQPGLHGRLNGPVLEGNEPLRNCNFPCLYGPMTGGKACDTVSVRRSRQMDNPTNSGEAQVPEVRPARKPYRKPAVRRLGTVRELTQHKPSQGKK